MPLYLGESSGARILVYGTGVSQVGDDFQASFATWDATPAGEVGDAVFRSVGLSFGFTNGYHFALQPIVDGVPMAETEFSGNGSGNTGQAQVFFAQRGTRLAVRFRTIDRFGDLDLYNLQATYAVLRQWP